MSLELQPINYKDACEFIKKYHRHHLPPQGWKFGIGLTLEVTRCCTDGTKNACSKLYAAAWRAARAMWYQRLITYILSSEPGTSLTAAGFKILYETKGHSWDHPSRKRTNNYPLDDKKLWEIK